jgi:hypothetical protein
MCPSPSPNSTRTASRSTAPPASAVVTARQARRSTSAATEQGSWREVLQTHSAALWPRRPRQSASPRAHRGEHHDLNFPRCLAVRYRRCRQPVAHRRDVTRPRLSPFGSMRGLSAGLSRQRVSRGFHRELAERQGDALRTTGRREERAARRRGAHDRPCQAWLPPCRVIAPTISRSLRRSPPAFCRSCAVRRSARVGAPPDRGWWGPHRTPRPPRGR